MKLLLVGVYPNITIARYLLSIYVLKAHLEKNFEKEFLEVDVLNISNITNPQDICNMIVEKNPDYIGYSCYTWNIEIVIEIIEGLMKTDSYTNILGGPEISINNALLLCERGIGNYFIIGEGEKKITGLMQYLADEERYSIPKGVIYRHAGKVIYEDDTLSFVDLNNEPSIYLSGTIDNNLYKLQQAFLETQRGCKYKCKYCVYHKYMNVIGYIPLDRILLELDHLIIRNKIRSLRLIDAIFTSDLDRAKLIVKHLIEIKRSNILTLPNIYWEFDYTSIDEEFIELVSQLKYNDTICNLNQIAALNRSQIYTDMLQDYTAINCVGQQSFNNKTLKAVGRKPFNKSKFDKFMKTIDRLNVILKLDIILGLPYETPNTYFEGLELLLPYLQGTDHVLNIHLLQIIPGSLLENEIDKYKIKKNSSNVVVSTCSFTENSMKKASKLTAILFRIINSPLRRHFFYRKYKYNLSLKELLEELYNELSINNKIKTSKLFDDCIVDDIYWNNIIFKEIPSEPLISLLTR